MGSFTGATIEEGAGPARGGCVGTWDDMANKLTIDCGGAIDSGQGCIVVLTRASGGCT
jgi:hypothetical protein